jgi:hypothetical protein
MTMILPENLLALLKWQMEGLKYKKAREITNLTIGRKRVIPCTGSEIKKATSYKIAPKARIMKKDKCLLVLYNE